MFLKILGQLGPQYKGIAALERLVSDSIEWCEDCDRTMFIPLSQCLPSPEGYLKRFINSHSLANKGIKDVQKTGHKRINVVGQLIFDKTKEHSYQI